MSHKKINKFDLPTRLYLVLAGVLVLVAGAILMQSGLFVAPASDLLAAQSIGIGVSGGGGSVSIGTGGGSVSIGAGAGSSAAPGCGGGDCWGIPAADTYGGIATQTTLRGAILEWVNFFLGFLALVAIIVMIYAGFMYVTAAGNDEQAGKAKQAIVYVAIGIIVILLAYVFVNALITRNGG